MLKKILKIMGCLIALFLLFVAFIWGSTKWSRYSKNREQVKYQREVCDTIKMVSEPIQIYISDFSKKELKEIHFYLQEGKFLKRDTVVSLDFKPDNTAQLINLPFKSFNITDQVIVKVAKRFFILSGIDYQAYYNYGMFGPVGPCQCGMTGFQTLNGKPAGSGWLIKAHGLLNDPLPPR
ncbi:hypothetical protein ACUN24_17195 [Pedobacter sp. WC2501]|jgi:hypothetical protein|uniref:hypothetical protein n=1 Tax=Pedobacter sp. WC2501 TaxID=3461400 RepID=UPI0040456682